MSRIPAALLAVILVAGSCRDAGPEPGPLSIWASAYPLSYVASRLAGPLATVHLLEGGGRYLDPTDPEIGFIKDADLVLVVGGGFQRAAEDAAESRTGERLFALAALESSGVRLATRQGGADPYFWLDPILMNEEAGFVLHFLKKLDARNSAIYEHRADALIVESVDLNRRIRFELANCRTRTFIISRPSFSYPAQAYSLHQVAISNSAGGTSSRRIAEVVAAARREGIRTVFAETGLPRGAAAAVARELGGRTAVLDPLERPPPDGDYFTAMRANLEALAEAMDCG